MVGTKVTGQQLKELRGLPLDSELYLDIVEPWKDDAILNDEVVDLARFKLEQFYVKQKLKYSIDGETLKPISSILKVLKLGGKQIFQMIIKSFWITNNMGR